MEDKLYKGILPEDDVNTSKHVAVIYKIGITVNILCMS